jgi:hemoglobin-like flavoprotein
VVEAADHTPQVYSKESERLVKQSWEVLKKDPQTNGIVFFTKVFEIAPQARPMFSFLRDTSVPFEKNPKVKNHALQVFRMTGDAASQLGDKGAFEILKPQLQKLAAKHVTTGVADAHFEVVKQALLHAVATGVPEQWSPELELAWGKAYDALATVLKDEMHAQAAAQKEI